MILPRNICVGVGLEKRLVQMTIDQRGDRAA
jgi:hypothetical protein